MHVACLLNTPIWHLINCRQMNYMVSIKTAFLCTVAATCLVLFFLELAMRCENNAF